MYDLIILATSPPSKLENDIKKKYDDPAMLLLHGVPRSLLPISGKPAMNWWFDELKSRIDGNVYLVTNAC
ncbi:7134_t:CDS:2, partial [Acaulospora colombiana]